LLKESEQKIRTPSWHDISHFCNSRNSIIMKKFMSYSSGILLMVFVFSACKKSENVVIPSASLMAFNLITDKDAVFITLSGNRLSNSPLGYTSFTGGYLPIYIGSRDIKSIDANTGSTLALSTQVFSDSMHYSLFTVGKNGSYRNVTVNDSLNKLIVSPGQAFVRYVNAIPDSTVSPLVTISSNGSNIVNTPAAFGTVSGFTKVSVGNINVGVNSGDSITATRSFPVEESKVYTILLTGMANAADTTRSVKIKYITNGTVTP
jgi:hypothetical protein